MVEIFLHSKRRYKSRKNGVLKEKIATILGRKISLVWEQFFDRKGRGSTLFACGCEYSKLLTCGSAIRAAYSAISGTYWRRGGAETGTGDGFAMGL